MVVVVNLCEGVFVFMVFLFIIVFLFLIFVIVIVFGNFLVCFVVLKDLYKCFKLLFIFFVVSFVVLDLIVGMVMEFILVWFYFCEGFFLKINYNWFVYMLYFIFCIVFVLNLVVLIEDCFIVIIYFF